MGKNNIYNSGYKFARDSNDRKRKLLIAVSILFPVFIVIILVYGFFSSLDSFQGTRDTVKKTLPVQSETEVVAEQSRKKTEAYANAGIPYSDPQGRFGINFVTPYVSSQVLVVFRNDKDYDNVKSEADSIIKKAKTNVPITEVGYTTLPSK